MKKQITALLIAASAVIAMTGAGLAESASESLSESETAAREGGGPGGMRGEMRGNGGMGGGTADKSYDTQLQEMIDEYEDQFTQSSYTDEETGLTIEYNLFLPKDYDESSTYPMVVFIGDSSTVGDDPTVSLTQGWGGLIWASDEVQEENECIVLVTSYSEVIIDDNNGKAETTDYLTATPNLIHAIAEEYAVDTNRIYGTGQSMGAMTMLYTAAQNPDLYAAIYVVDGQWDTADLAGLEGQNIFYIAAGGDEKASQGQEDLKAMLDTDGVSYAEADGWDAQDTDENLEAAVEELLAQGEKINFATRKAGTVLEGDSAALGSEHMASFDYAYQLSAVRNWLFEQTKGEV